LPERIIPRISTDFAQMPAVEMKHLGCDEGRLRQWLDALKAQKIQRLFMHGK